VGTDVPEPMGGVRLTQSTRIEAFSDAVMAIVIPIVVLELRVPPHDRTAARSAAEYVGPA